MLEAATQERIDTVLTSSTADNMPIQTAPGVQVLGSVAPDQVDILSVEAQRFVATLHRCFNARRKELLHRRVMRQYEIDAGNLPGTAQCLQHSLVCICCIDLSCAMIPRLLDRCMTVAYFL